MKIHPCHKSMMLAAAILFLTTAGAQIARAQTAQENYTPTPENLKARTWFQDAKFGMFIHWGVYSVLGNGEWIMENRPINRTDYAKLPAFFNPIKFDPAAWVALAKAAGMKYITITSKHHDGFAMFDSHLTDWTVVQRTSYGKDVLGMLAAECHKQGIKLFFYHSQLDWHSTDYFPRGRTGHRTGRPDSGNWDTYLNFMDGQLRELLTNYGEIGGIWFDGMWDKPDADWHLARTYGLIHQLQPQALVGSNHHKTPFPGEDFQMFEKDLPGQHTTGFNQEQTVSALPLETAETMNDAWGFNLTDEHYKSTGDLVRYLVRAAGSNANFLLNIGPMPSGEIQPEFVQHLTEVGQWMKQYGESIYATRGGPVAAGPWGVTTQKGSTVYVHVLDWNQPVLALAGLPRPVHSAKLLRDGSGVEFSTVKGGLVLKIPEAQTGEIDRVFALELEAAK
ncbi:MAG TPA: alpha-L-fucosidase [Candidatus Acidoferrum sp.]|nr:alpha-L-fucosidase [Candidatus Acidoferrum sp.]